MSVKPLVVALSGLLKAAAVWSWWLAGHGRSWYLAHAMGWIDKRNEKKRKCGE